MAPGGLIEMSQACTWPPTQTQAVAKVFKPQVSLLCQIEVPMGTTNRQNKQDSGVFSFLWEAFMLRCHKRAGAVSNTVTKLMLVG